MHASNTNNIHSRLNFHVGKSDVNYEALIYLVSSSSYFTLDSLSPDGFREGKRSVGDIHNMKSSNGT